MSVFAKPSPSQSVYREDCTQCFDSIDDAAGVDVCLGCFNGGCAGDQRHAALHSTIRHHPLALNIRRTRKNVVRDEPPAKISKLAIAAETEADRYDTALAIKCHACAIDTLDPAHPKLAPIVEAIMAANTFSRKEEVKAWEQEMTGCEHILMLQQPEPRSIASQDLGHCSECSLKENLWLCLECGSLGCGRAQFGGTGGNSHALAHAQQSRHGVAVKLGSITPEGTADVYCYTCDDERVDGDLAVHLANWGIILSEQHKTEKSLTEMQIEQNMRWEFSMTSGDGLELTPLFGPGLTGLKNLGNSCYMASIIQCLFDIPAFKARYFDLVAASPLPDVPDPAEDLETQLRKMGHGLLSGRYSKPDAEVTLAGVAGPGPDPPPKPYQRGLAPSMLKHLIGRNHAEFSSMRQQDAFEFLQHLVKLVTRSPHTSPAQDPTQAMRFAMEQRLQCTACRKVRYHTNEQDAIFIDVPLEKLPGDAEGGQPQYKAVTFKECLDKLTAEEPVELTCGACGSKDGFVKSLRFKTFPDTLVINARKMTVVNWVPVKVDVPVLVGDEPFLLDDYSSVGQQPGEEALPDEDAEADTGGGDAVFVPNVEAFAQLEAMGFPRVRCEKALHATSNADANTAMEWLFSHMDDPDIDAPVVLLAGPASAASGAVDPEKTAMLESMGFSGSKASKALRETNGDVERAIEWLFSHPDDQGDDEAAAGEGAGAETSKTDQVAGDGKLPARFQLQSIVCHKGTSIHAGHYVAFIRKKLGEAPAWVLYNDEKVVEAAGVEETKQFAYVYFFRRV